MEHLEDSECASNQSEMSRYEDQERVVHPGELHGKRREVQSEENPGWQRFSFVVSWETSG